jgi:ABC-type bacteriocin/lantibiotic exporter with double-glycine peptidase domain
VSIRPIAIDGAIAVVIAALVVIISPGLAVTGMIALLVLLVLAISFAVQSRRHRRRAGAAGPGARSGGDGRDR